MVFDVLVFQPPEAIDQKDISYRYSTLAISGNGTNSGNGGGGPADDNTRDVNRDGFVSPLDALIVINSLNTGGSSGEGETGNRMDVNRDGSVTPVDALIIINYLNGADGEGEGEGLVVDALASSQPTELPAADSDDVLPGDDESATDFALRVGAADEAVAVRDPMETRQDLFESLLDELAEDVFKGWS